ncbi:MAG TPA: SDR family oxidoreductase [Parafilimonas sp.]|nr:SDR family oxidoreductase [Parafilimonas sp.]
MQILITGANGFLGQHLSVYLKQKDFDVISTSRGECRIPSSFNVPYYPAELTQRSDVEQLVSATKPDVIIHSAAMSKPDECETDREKCILYNVSATQFLLTAFERTANTNSHFIFTSTDFVFGEGGPHSENDVPEPINFYGESKLMAEKLLAETSVVCTIVRPVFMYGPVWSGVRSSYLQQVKNALQQNQPIKAVSDQLRTPTYVYDVCKGIEAIIVHKQAGVYHLAGRNVLSPYQMALSVAHYFHLDSSLIQEVTLNSFFEAARRPLRSGLKIAKAEEELGYDPVTFEEGIKLTFSH